MEYNINGLIVNPYLHTTAFVLARLFVYDFSNTNLKLSSMSKILRAICNQVTVIVEVDPDVGQLVK